MRSRIYFVMNGSMVYRLSGTFLLMVFFSFFSCKKDEPGRCMKSTGPVTDEMRVHSGFTRVYVEDFVQQDTVFEVRIEAGKNLLPHIITEVKGDTLRISNHNRCDWLRTYKKAITVYVKLPVVSYLINFGSGVIKTSAKLTTHTVEYRVEGPGSLELEVDNAKVIGHMHGSGDVILRGNTGEHACHFVGNGFVKASALHSNYTWLLSRTTGDMYINVRDHLVAHIHSYGNVYYNGTPARIEKYITGKGGLVKQN
jgi:hypothetical protein